MATLFVLSHFSPLTNLLFFKYQQDPNGGYAGGPGQASNCCAFHLFLLEHEAIVLLNMILSFSIVRTTFYFLLIVATNSYVYE